MAISLIEHSLEQKDLVKSWSINDREVQLFLDPNQKFVALIRDGAKTHLVREITDQFRTIVGIPATLSTNKERASRFFEVAHPKIIPFDQAYKLDFTVSGVGGNLTTILAKTNSQIEEILISRLPNDSYELVHVSSGAHRFPGAGSLPSRIITLHVSSTRYGWSFLGALFSGLLSLNDEDFYKTNLHKANLQNQLIKTMTGEREGDGTYVNTDQILAAYKQCSSIQLYISQDGNNIEIAFQTSRVIGTAYTVGHVSQRVFTLAAQSAFLLMLVL